MLEITRIPGSRNYRLTCETRLSAPIEEVFGFFSDAMQLERLTPKWLHFEIVTPVPIAMQQDALIDYKLRVHGISLRWQSRISQWEPPYRFADEQLRGPYRRWYHVHTFERDGVGTICRDDVEYSVPGGPLVHSLFVKRDLRRIFKYRIQMLRATFSTIPHTYGHSR